MKRWSSLKNETLVFSSVIIFLVAFGSSGASSVWNLLEAPYLYQKDFYQEYVLAKALRWGINPYLPLPELREIFGLSELVYPLPHPTPHPIFLGLLTYPISFFTLEIATVVWALLEYACVILAVILTMRTLRPGSGLGLQIGCGFAATALWPIHASIIWGQINSLLLLVTVVLCMSIVTGRRLIVGISLGLLLGMKFFGIPIVLYYTLRRSWSVLATAALTFGLIQICSLAAVGWDVYSEYFRIALPTASDLYFGYTWYPGNYSFPYLFTFAYESVHPLKPELFHMEAAPHFPEEWLAVVRYGGLAVSILVAAMLAYSMRDEVRAIAFLALTNSFLTPISWKHGFALSFPALLITTLIVLQAPQIRNGKRFILIALFLLFHGSIPLQHYTFDSALTFDSPLILTLSYTSPLLCMILIALGLYFLDRRLPIVSMYR